MRSIFPVVLLVLAFGAGVGPRVAVAQARDTVVVLVRHAEKAAPANEQDKDPPLTAEGSLRATALARTLANAGVSAIYSTGFQRTRATAAPIAQQLSLSITEYDADEAPAAFAARILATHRGGTVLVVGHSNTVPALVQAFSGEEIGAIADDEYDRLFVVAIDGEGKARVVRANLAAR